MLLLRKRSILVTTISTAVAELDTILGTTRACFWTRRFAF